MDTRKSLFSILPDEDSFRESEFVGLTEEEAHSLFRQKENTHSGLKVAEIAAMAKDLCGHSMRGPVLSVPALAWHGLGFDTGCGVNSFAFLVRGIAASKPVDPFQNCRNWFRFS